MNFCRKYLRATYTIWVVAVILLTITAARSENQQLYSVEEAMAKGVVNARINIFNPAEEQHALEALTELNPGWIYGTFVGVWGVTRQQDVDAGGRLAKTLREHFPRTLLGSGLNESISLANPPQTLACGGTLGMRTFAPAAMITPGKKELTGTAWLDLAKDTARDYYLCIGTMLIDRGYTVIGFAEHSNVIAHASSKSAAIENFVEIMSALRRYGASKGEKIYFSGDPSNDETAKKIDFLYVPSRFYHIDFAQKYQNKVLRPCIGVGYTYSLSPLRVQDVLAETPRNQRVFFYVDNWDAKQDDLRRFMELDAENRRSLIETSARTAHAKGAYFIPSLLHCVGCIPPEVVGDRCEMRPNGKSEYDAVTCSDVDAIKKALEIEK
jgi:hypothetical protein